VRQVQQIGHGDRVVAQVRSIATSLCSIGSTVPSFFDRGPFYKEQRQVQWRTGYAAMPAATLIIPSDGRYVPVGRHPLAANSSAYSSEVRSRPIPVHSR
jgi:hypothetical protein